MLRTIDLDIKIKFRSPADTERITPLPRAWVKDLARNAFPRAHLNLLAILLKSRCAVVSSPSVSSLPEISVPDGSQKSGKPAASASALLVSNIQEDHQFLEEIFFQKQWMLFRTGSVGDALSVLGGNEIPVVISERDVSGGGWKGVLSAIERLPRPPLLVVTSRLADERLWAEVLNLGGHDVLATPFRVKELVWVMENAWHRYGFTLRAKATAAACATGF